MNLHVKLAVLTAGAVLLAGCSLGSALLNNKSAVPQASQINVGNPLAMPPDLQLAVPSQTTDAYQPNQGTNEPVVDTALADQQPVQQTALAGTSPALAKSDIYQQYGISKVKPDGTSKTKDELTAELKKAILLKKRQANPKYGTVLNIGSIFKDQ